MSTISMSSISQGMQSRVDENHGKIIGVAVSKVPDVMSTSTFAGVTVISVDGHDVGKVSEIMADMRNGRIAYDGRRRILGRRFHVTCYSVERINL